jgi:hypothetical protein
MVDNFYPNSSSESILDFVRRRKNEGAVCPTFRGYEPFVELWKIGAVTPYQTSIRLFVEAGYDQHYSVISEIEVEGVEAVCHSGISGIHNIEELLRNPDYKYWEISGLNPRVINGNVVTK